MCFYTCISKNKHCQNFGYFGQFVSIQLDSQPSHQTGKLKTAAFSAQQLSLHSSFPCTASQPQPKQIQDTTFSAATSTQA
jgi:hypothetical protein